MLKPNLDIAHTCDSLTRMATPEPRQGNMLEASVTWMRWPYTYVLKRFDIIKDRRRLFAIQQRAETLGFELWRGSAKRSDTDLHNISRYYILPEFGLIGAIHSELPLPDDMTESDKDAYRSNLDFILETRLNMLNAEDEVEVEYALNLALQDGYRPLADHTSPEQ